MAIVTKPTWTPKRVPTLPAMTSIVFKVVVGAAAKEGIVIEYVLHSERARFAAGAKPPKLSPDEQTGSSPTLPDLVPTRRESAVVIDRLPGAKANDVVEIIRALSLSELPSPSGGFASVTVTVSDLKTGGVPTDPFVNSAAIRL